MLHRKGVAMVAACAALACAGIVRAESNDSLSDGVVLRPNYLQATAPTSEPATAPASQPAAAPSKPLMLLLEQVGVGKPLEDAGFTLGGYIEGGYTVSGNGDSSHSFLAGRFFDNKNNSVVLDQIDVFVDRPVDYGKAATNHTFDIGGHVELVYGWDSGLIHSSGLLDNPSTLGVVTGSYPSRTHPENQLDVEQAYLDFALPVGTGLRIRAGKFVTLLGLETINPTTNPFYSHTYLFSFAIPLTQTGVMGEYKLSDDFLLDLGVTRGWNQSFKDNNGDPDILGELTWTPQESDFLKKWKVLLNVSEGPQATHDNHDWWTVLDLVATYTVDDKLSLSANADYGDAPMPGKPAQWYGVAGYASYILNKYVTPNLRLEYYADDTGFTIANPGGGHVTLYEATLNAAIKPFPDDVVGSNLVIRPEIRYDYSGQPFFHPTATGAKHDQFTFGVDAYFTF
jgi:hypothetical protein